MGMPQRNGSSLRVGVQLIIISFLLAWIIFGAGPGLWLTETSHSAEWPLGIPESLQKKFNLIIYQGEDNGYIVQIVEIVDSPQYARFSVSLCPKKSGPLCWDDEISATQLKPNEQWGKVHCGTRLCENQQDNMALIQHAMDAVHKPQFIVSPYVSRYET